MASSSARLELLEKCKKSPENVAHYLKKFGPVDFVFIKLLFMTRSFDALRYLHAQIDISAHKLRLFEFIYDEGIVEIFKFWTELFADTAPVLTFLPKLVGVLRECGKEYFMKVLSIETEFLAKAMRKGRIDIMVLMLENFNMTLTMNQWQELLPHFRGSGLNCILKYVPKNAPLKHKKILGHYFAYGRSEAFDDYREYFGYTKARKWTVKNRPVHLEHFYSNADQKMINNATMYGAFLKPNQLYYPQKLVKTRDIARIAGMFNNNSDLRWLLCFYLGKCGKLEAFEVCLQIAEDDPKLSKYWNAFAQSAMREGYHTNYIVENINNGNINIDFAIDGEIIARSSPKLIRTIAARLGQTFIETILVNGQYFAISRAAEEGNIHLIKEAIKCSEFDAKQMVFSNPLPSEIVHVIRL